MTAQTMRAILLASATVTSLAGFLAARSLIQAASAGPAPSGRRRTEVAREQPLRRLALLIGGHDLPVDPGKARLERLDRRNDLLEHRADSALSGVSASRVTSFARSNPIVLISMADDPSRVDDDTTLAHRDAVAGVVHPVIPGRRRPSPEPINASPSDVRH
jgi:hypothetical protein